MNSTENRRRSFRIDNPLAIDYRILSVAQMRCGIRKMKAGGFPPGGVAAVLFGMENEIQEKLAILRRRAPDAATSVELVNDKLNALINVLPLLHETENRILDKPLRSANLSASGIAFVNHEPLNVGDNLYLRFVLAPNYVYVEAYAKVIRCDGPLDGGDADFPYNVAVDFEMITDSQRELLVRYTMNRQSEVLRARRMHSA